MLSAMPTIRLQNPRRAAPARVVVLGDLMLDVVLMPSVAPETGTDVPGSVMLRQGGSAANTARWLARLGAASTLVTAVGRDVVGRSLVGALHDDRVTVRAARPVGLRTGRIGVIVGIGGERSFIADRGAADGLAPGDLRATWFARTDLLHLPFYSLLGEPLGSAGRRAVALTRAAGGLVSVDLASAGPLLSEGRRRALARLAEAAPDLLFATAAEAQSLLGGGTLDRLLDLAPIAVVKRGAKGATVIARGGPAGGPGAGPAGRPGGGPGAGSGQPRLRFDVATRPIEAADTTGAGDAFDAGFIVAWLRARSSGAASATALPRCVLAGHRAAARQLTSTPVELSFR